MNGSFGSSNDDSSSRPSLLQCEVSVYLRDYADSLDARCFQAMFAYREICTFCDERHMIICNSRVRAWIKR